MSDLTAQEKGLLVTLLEKRETELRHELHHAVSHDFKEGLKAELAIVEALKGKLQR